jgi:GNAT superfamily N-acetyltransferase
MPAKDSPTPPVDELGRLRDGTLVRVRSALPTDRLRVMEFLRHVSRNSLEQRFLGAMRPETAAPEILRPCGPSDRVSLLLELPGTTLVPVIAHGEYVRSESDPSRAEVAFLVADDRQGQGAATLLLVQLARRARSAGVQRFDALVLPENRPMLDVFLGAGFPCSLSVHDALEHVSLDIAREPLSGTALMDSPGNRPRLRS